MLKAALVNRMILRVRTLSVHRAGVEEGRGVQRYCSGRHSADYIVDLWASAAPNSSDIVTMFERRRHYSGALGPAVGNMDEAAGRGQDLDRQSRPELVWHHPGAFVDRRRRLDYRLYQGSQEPGLYQPQSRQKRDPVDLAWPRILTVDGLVAASATAGILTALGIALRRAKENATPSICGGSRFMSGKAPRSCFVRAKRWKAWAI